MMVMGTDRKVKYRNSKSRNYGSIIVEKVYIATVLNRRLVECSIEKQRNVEDRQRSTTEKFFCSEKMAH